MKHIESSHVFLVSQREINDNTDTQVNKSDKESDRIRPSDENPIGIQETILEIGL